jgi:glycosyltransferase involved in cell wall biosynthesis
MTAHAEPLEVTVLLPCLNEARTVAVCVRKALGSLQRLGLRGEVVVSDNGSTDGSPDLAVAAGARVVHALVRGYGSALLAGIEAARGRYIVMGDADDSYELSELGPFVAELAAGRDVVIGNRFRGGIAPGAMPWLHRFIGNPVLSWLGRILFGLRGVGDFHCGLRAFRRERILALGLCMPGMEFASELVIRAALAGYSISEVPTTLRPDGRDRRPHLRTWRDGWRHLRFLVVFAPGKSLIAPGTLLMLLGTAGMLWLLPGERRIGGVNFDVSALVYTCLSILVGAQLLIFGGFARLYGIQEGITKQFAHALWTRLLRLETCAAVGLGLIGLGTAGTLIAIAKWSDTDFGPLDPRKELRIVVPSATAIALGVLVIFSGLFASLLSLRTFASGQHPASPISAPPKPWHLTKDEIRQ